MCVSSYRPFSRWKRLAALTGAGLLLAAAPARMQGADWSPLGPNGPDVQFHGFASQGFLGTTGYDYLGDTKEGSFEFTELGLNVSVNPFPRTLIMAQAFAYDVGDAGRYDPLLDYALAQYTFNDYFGIRAGRIRRPQGIYNDIQDVDLGRTFVLLPQGVYDARWRDFYVSLDGIDLFGTLPLKNEGSLGYEIYGGEVRPSLDGGAAQAIENGLPPSTHLDDIKPLKIAGGQLWWNTPINGFRLGASGAVSTAVDYPTTTQTPYGDIRVVNRSATAFEQYSAEYLYKAWTFQSELLFLDNYGKSPGLPDSYVRSWYASTAYRFNKWLEAGTYYTQYNVNVNYPNGSGLKVPSDGHQDDAAVTLRFDLTDKWIFKVEGHYLRGTALLEDDEQNPIRHDNPWWMIAVKSTINF